MKNDIITLRRELRRITRSAFQLKQQVAGSGEKMRSAILWKPVLISILFLVMNIDAQEIGKCREFNEGGNFEGIILFNNSLT